jgi:hypothetical protein
MPLAKCAKPTPDTFTIYKVEDTKIGEEGDGNTSSTIIEDGLFLLILDTPVQDVTPIPLPSKGTIEDDSNTDTTAYMPCGHSVGYGVTSNTEINARKGYIGCATFTKNPVDGVKIFEVSDSAGGSTPVCYSLLGAGFLIDPAETPTFLGTALPLVGGNCFPVRYASVLGFIGLLRSITDSLDEQKACE